MHYNSMKVLCVSNQLAWLGIFFFFKYIYFPCQHFVHCYTWASVNSIAGIQLFVEMCHGRCRMERWRNCATQPIANTCQPSGEKEFTPFAQDLEDSVRPGPQARPTVIRWAGGGKEVYIAGSFNNWCTKIPLNKRWASSSHPIKCQVDLSMCTTIITSIMPFLTPWISLAFRRFLGGRWVLSIYSRLTNSCGKLVVLIKKGLPI